MTEAQFKDMCRTASLALGIEDTEVLAEHGRVQVDSVNMGVFFDEESAPETVICYVDLGSVDAFNKAEVYESLLELNILTGSKSNGVFGLDPDSGNAVMVAHMKAPAEPDGERLANLIRLFSTQAVNLGKSMLRSPAVNSKAPSEAMTPFLQMA